MVKEIILSPDTEFVDARAPALIFFNGYGDRLMSLPSIRAIAYAFPRKLTLICGIGDSKLFYSGIPLRRVHETEFRKDGNGWWFDHTAVLRFVFDCDLLLSLNPWSSASMYALLEEVKQLRCIRALGLKPPFEVIRRTSHSMHAIDRSFQMVKRVCPTALVEDFADPPELPSKALEDVKLLRMSISSNVRILAVHTETVPAKMIPKEVFCSIISRFLAEKKRFVALILDVESNDEYLGFNDRVFHTPVPLATAFGLVSISDLFVGIDSCMLHAADIFRVPGVGIFGPTDPEHFGFRFSEHRHVRLESSVMQVDPSLVIRQLLTLCSSDE